MAPASPPSLPPELCDRFESPDPSFGPTPLWWWSADPVTEERISWQLDRFIEGGIRNLVVMNLAPAGPQFGMRADDPTWFSETWWDRFGFTCRRAEELGIGIWFYDQIGFSGANIQGRVTGAHPEYTGETLAARRESPHAGRVPCAAGERVVAAFDANRRRVPCGADGTLDGSADGELLVVVARPTAFDYLSKPAVAALLDSIHGEFERRLPHYLGSVIRGSFQDELPPTNRWSRDFAAEFTARKGYDILDVCHALFEPGDARSAKIRTDYYDVRGALTEEALYRPLGQWHERHGMLVGADQTNPGRAGYPIESTQLYTDYFRTHRHLGAVGSDHEGDAKVHASMAHLYGHERVWIEAFHSSGWGGTLEETWDWLVPFFRSGATLYDPHATYYATDAGFFEWAPPATDWRQPYWRHYPQFAQAVERTCALGTWGTYCADVAVLFPVTSVQAEVTLDLPTDYFDATGRPERPRLDAMQRTYLDLVGKNDWFRTRQGLLDGAGIAFDIVDEPSVQRAEVADGALRVAELSYRTVLLPGVIALHAATARRLLEFVAGGGRVILVTDRPEFAAGAEASDDDVRRLAAHPRVEFAADAEAAVRLLDARSQQVYSDVPLLVRREGDAAIAFVPGAHPNAMANPIRPEEDGYVMTDYDFDRRRYATERLVTIRGSLAHAEVWNPATGERRAAPVEASDAEHATVRVEHDGAPLVFLVWRWGEATTSREAGRESAGRPASAGEPALLTDWTAQLVPTLDNTWGDFAMPAGSPLAAPQIWSWQWREDHDEWRHTKATFGPAARVLDPTPHPPAPLTPAECAAMAAGERELGGAAWREVTYSPSRGPERDVTGQLAGKGAIPSEFVFVPRPAPGHTAVVRTLIETDHRGPADLLIAALAAKRAWLNGVEVPLPPAYTGQAGVTIDRGRNVLEYWLQAPPSDTDSDGRGDSDGPGLLGSAFSLGRPGGFTARPEFMRFPATEIVGDGTIAFSARVPHLDAVERARLVVGSARTARISLDGQLVSRQEQVQYYDSETTLAPAFFTHDVTDLVAAGAETLRIELDQADPSDTVFVDLAVWHAGGIWTLPSGAGWHCATGGSKAESIVALGPWAPADCAHAVHRPHPLPEATWLRGPAQVGHEPVRFAATPSARPREQHYRIRLPAGAHAARLPLRIEPSSLTLAGADVTWHDGRASWGQPLARPEYLEITVPPQTCWRAGAAWDGPIEIEHSEAPIQLGRWDAIGLDSWSGAVRYRHRLADASAAGAVLDLGDLRGTVTVALDGAEVGQAFCGPFRFQLPAAGAGALLEVTVYGTLGPYLHEATPTRWVFPAQRASGLFGPIHLVQPAS